jgi:hypothetical protein
MGIKNFQTYIKTFFGHGCFKEFTVMDACDEIKDFTSDELHRTVAVAATAAPVEESNTAASDGKNDIDQHKISTTTIAPTTVDGKNYRCGVYIDLSSYMYGRMIKSLENMGMCGNVKYLFKNTDKTKTVVCELDKCTIDKIVKDCEQTLLGTLAPLLLKAYRVYLAFDTFQPIGKQYEQSRRKSQRNFLLSSNSRETCYKEIARKVKRFITEAHLKTLDEYYGDNRPDVYCSVRKVIDSKLYASGQNDFAMGEGEWKCFYRMYEDITSGSVDVCYVFGRDWDIGLAMTMYQHPNSPEAIKYIYGPNDMFEHKKSFDNKERMLHFVCLALFGNDYIGGLVNLSSKNAELLKNEMSNIYSGDGGSCTFEQAEYLSNALFANLSFTPVSEVLCAEFEVGYVENRKKLSIAFATVVTRLLLAVYGDHKNRHPNDVENVLHYAGIGPFSIGKVTTNSETPTPLTGLNRDTLDLRKYLANRRSENEEKTSTNKTTDNATSAAAAAATDDDDDAAAAAIAAGVNTSLKCDSTTDESTMLTCRDTHGNQVMRTLQQCMDCFATSLLWYLSYTTFYFRSPSGRKQLATTNHDLPMIIGMQMRHENAFRYNDTRLLERFDVCRLLELKGTLQRIDCCRLYWIIEGAFAKALDLV